MQLPMDGCKKKLSLVWFIGGGALFFFLMLQSLLGKYAGHTRDAWEWFLPNVLPTLSLIIGVFVVDMLGQGLEKKTVDRFMFNLTLAMSGLYLLATALPILLLPFVAVKPEAMVAFLKQSNIWLGPFQGLVSASLAVFFVWREKA